MLLIVYQALGAVALAALLLLAPFVPALRRGLRERLGGAARGEAAAGTIWVHAASVGEVRAAAPLIGALLRERPDARVLLSTFTPGGRRVAEETVAAGEPRVRCRFLPLDWGWIPAAAVRRERPALFVLLETELWPVLLVALRRAGVPVLVVNGRISPRRAGRYVALRRAL
ncbi:MAG TPA: glycosyltransferase N-terminal domain-containing protein, partial [bacterium]